MKRRIIQLGGRTLLVSIPYKWASEHDVTKGSEINITETPQGILLHTADIIPRKDVLSIDSKDFGRLLRRAVLACYTSGAYEIVVSHKSSDVEGLRDLTKEFVGFDIISQSDDRTVFRDFSTVDESNVQIVLQRAFMILKTMILEGRDGLSGNIFGVYEIVKQLDVNLNRACNYCYRFSRKNRIPVQDAVVLQLVTCALEKSGDIYKEMVRVSVEDGVDSIIKIHDSVENLFGSVCSFSLKRSSDHALDCADAYDSMKLVVDDMPKTRTSLLACQLLSSLMDIQSYQLGMVEDLKKDL